jgi:hypothetical protein
MPVTKKITLDPILVPKANHEIITSSDKKEQTQDPILEPIPGYDNVPTQDPVSPFAPYPPVDPVPEFYVGKVMVDVLQKRKFPSLRANVSTEPPFHKGDKVNIVSLSFPLPDLTFGLLQSGTWVVVKSGDIDYIKLKNS